MAQEAHRQIKMIPATRVCPECRERPMPPSGRPRRARAPGVRAHLVHAGNGRFLGDFFQDRTGPGELERQDGVMLALLGAGNELLDDTVFQGMEGDDRQDAARGEETGGLERNGEVLDLGVDLHAQGLKGACGGMDMPRPEASGDGPAHAIGQLREARCSMGAVRNDPWAMREPKAFFAQGADDALQFGLVIGIDERMGAHAAFGQKAHVQGPV